MSNDEFSALHDRAQESLKQYVTTNRAWRRVEQRQRLLLNMMNNDSEFLLSSRRLLSYSTSGTGCFRLSEVEIGYGAG